MQTSSPTSITTRIETGQHSATGKSGVWLLHPLPLQQGLKLGSPVFSSINTSLLHPLPLQQGLKHSDLFAQILFSRSSSPTSITTRIETWNG